MLSHEGSNNFGEVIMVKMAHASSTRVYCQRVRSLVRENPELGLYLNRTQVVRDFSSVRIVGCVPNMNVKQLLFRLARECERPLEKIFVEVKVIGKELDRSIQATG